MNENILSADEALRVWKQVIPVPPGYYQVIRRSFDNGLHVLILVRKTGDGFIVASSVDHGTVRPTEIIEGSASTFTEVLDLLRLICARWDALHPVKTSTGMPERKQYFHADESGKLAGPVMREDLFEMLRTGAVTWETQVWENMDDGAWQPILIALGFPPERPDHSLV